MLPDDPFPVILCSGSGVGCSPFSLARVFRAVTGESIHQYRMRARCELGLALLLDTRLSVSEVAHTVGFSSHSHFTRTFPRYFGVAPHAARVTAGSRGRRRAVRRQG